MERELNFSLCDLGVRTALFGYHLQSSRVPHWNGTNCLKCIARLLNMTSHVPNQPTRMTIQHHFVQLPQNIVPTIMINLRFHELVISHEYHLLQATECMSMNDLTNKRLFFSHIKVSRGGRLLLLAGQWWQGSGLESLDVLGLSCRVLRCLPQT